jgi:hypothetical protein
MDIKVYDFGSTTETAKPRLFRRHQNVPDTWTSKDIVTRFGMAEHWLVTRINEDGTEMIIQSPTF